MNTYLTDGQSVDSVDLKTMLVTREIKVNNQIYKNFGNTYRIYPGPVKM